MKISKIWFENNRIYGLTDDGRTLWQSLLYYRWMMRAYTGMTWMRMSLLRVSSMMTLSQQVSL